MAKGKSDKNNCAINVLEQTFWLATHNLRKSIDAAEYLYTPLRTNPVSCLGDTLLSKLINGEIRVKARKTNAEKRS
jgi:hypothetical protein